jgi:hypothetical protein
MTGTNWDELRHACRVAMVLAAEEPGRYGGRYVARSWVDGRTLFIVLADDDPDVYQDDDDLDVLA